MPRKHDTEIWTRIVEAFSAIDVAGNPTAIAKELDMAQPSVRQWKLGETTPSRAHILEIAKKTGYLSGYLEDAKLPKKAPVMQVQEGDPLLEELMHAWEKLSWPNKGRLLERAEALLQKQFPERAESSPLHRRSG